ncbi:FIGNL1-interacting regulator of recombination and mitosis-like isoform X2 [Rhopilema esculentum]|uniref:FIGNL1-interacting regulator of recombination and mitosis-like isoform X2 n=1 Tax=Rhopilema esculentum TaxID=499914 RepID=UPI0031DCE6F3
MSQEYSFITSGLRIKQDNIKNLAKDLKLENLNGVIQSLIRVFEQLQNELPQSILQLCSFISESANHLKKDELANLANHAIQELESYFRDWCMFCEHYSSLQLNHENGIFVLYNFIIKDIEEIFKHCKESSRIYDRCFLEVSASLSSLFKMSYQSLKMILEMFEKPALDQLTEDEVSQFSEGIMQLLRLTLILKDIDIMPLVNTLRSLNRMIIGKRDCLRDKLDCVKIFTTICTCITEKLNFCWSVIQENALRGQASSKRSSKIIKALRFLVGMLLQLIKEYKNEVYGDSTTSIIEILLSLQWLAPMSFHQDTRRTPLYEEFCSAVLSVIEPLLSELLQERDFITKFLSIKGTFQDAVSERNVLSALLLSASISSLLARAEDDIKSDWMNEVAFSPCATNIVDLIVTLYEQSRSMNLDSISLPNFVEAGRPMRDVSLHEHCYIRTCALVATFSQREFQKMESSLLKHLLLQRCFSFFVADILSFVARWGPESLCFQQAEFFIHMILAVFEISSMQSKILNRCSFVLQRLFLLLGDVKKEEFLKRILSRREDVVTILSMLPFSRMSQDLQEKYLGTIISKTLNGLEEYKTKENQNMMMMVIKVWEQSLASVNAFQLLSPLQRNGVITTLMDVFEGFQDSQCTEIDEQFVCLILGATSKIVCFLDMRQIELTLRVCLTLAESNHSECLFVQLCKFLSALKMEDFTNEFQGACLPYMIKLFQALLAHKSPFVRIEALQCLVQFSEASFHADVLYQCLPETMVESYESLSSKTVLLDELTDREKRSDCQIACENQSAPISMPEAGTGELLRLENDLTKVVAEIKKYAEKSSIPDWMAKNFSAIVQDLNTIRT